MLSKKRVFRSNDLAFEVGSEGWVLISQSFRKEYQPKAPPYDKEMFIVPYLGFAGIRKGMILSCQRA